MAHRSSFDFSPFDTVGIAKMRREQKRAAWIGVGVSSAVLATAVVIMVVAGVPSEYGLQAFGMLALYCFIFIAAYMRRPVKRMIFTARAAFAERNGGSVSDRIGLSHEPGIIFAPAHRPKLKGNVINGMIAGLPFQQYRCTYTFMDEGGRMQRRDADVLAVGLPHAHPQVLIDSRTSSGNWTMLPVRVAKDQHIQLEGDFSRYFAVYAPHGHKLHAVDILAPDVMQKLLEYARPCDVEIVGNRLYFYWTLLHENSEDYTKMFTVAEAVLREIKHKLTRPPATMDTSQRLAEEIPPASLRTKPVARGAFLWATIIIVLMSAFIAIFGRIAGIDARDLYSFVAFLTLASVVIIFATILIKLRTIRRHGKLEMHNHQP